MKPLLPPQCPLPFIYLTWALYVGGLVYLPATGRAAFALVWLVALPFFWWAYVRLFPRVSVFLGYGRVDDVPAQSGEPQEAAGGPAHTPPVVTMYSSLGCPFCPLVEDRLRSLQKAMGFELEHVDVTLKPHLVRSKSIGAVPVVEVEDRRWVGHATSRELAELIGGAPAR